MARDIVDIALPSISWSGGSEELADVVSFTRTKSNPKTPVKTMNRRRRAIGFTAGVPDFTYELTVAVTKGVANRWRTLLESGETFLYAWEEGDGGLRYQAVDCVVNEISDPFEESGELRETVSIVALDERQEPTT